MSHSVTVGMRWVAPPQNPWENLVLRRAVPASGWFQEAPEDQLLRLEEAKCFPEVWQNGVAWVPDIHTGAGNDHPHSGWFGFSAKGGKTKARKCFNRWVCDRVQSTRFEQTIPWLWDRGVSNFRENLFQGNGVMLFSKGVRVTKGGCCST